MKTQLRRTIRRFVVTIPFGRFPRRPATGSAAAAALMLGLAAVAFQFSAPASARSTSSSCADPVTSAPAGPATVSVASGSFGKVLVVGSGDYSGCSLYLITSDELHALAGTRFACSDEPNAKGLPCDTVIWPALLTNGAPIAGPGVNPRLLGTVTRTDLPGLSSVQQVTYAGMPLYRFFRDEVPGETEGANLFDPVSSPTGIWYLVEPSRGRPAPGTATLQLETAPVAGTGPAQTVLAAKMDNDFGPLLPNAASFPAYTLSPDRGHWRGSARMDRASGCRTLCAQYWPPVITSGQPQAGPGVDQHALGTITRPDGTQQVTDNGRPLYLFTGDAYLPPFSYNGGKAAINGAGAETLWGVFDTIPPSSP